MTFSVVARDAATGQLGVAIQSRVLAVGASCPRAEPGVGVVVTQAFMQPSYGPKTLAMLRDGISPDQALATLTSEDSLSVTRQVAAVDVGGRVGVHTGRNCIPATGHVVGDGFSCQANMMRSEGVPEAMAEALTTADGDFKSRLLAALDAAEAAGGDIRGRQSAALIIVAGEKDAPMGGELLNLRVDDNAEPLVELRRLVELRNAGMAGDGGDRLAALDRGNPEGWFWSAIHLVGQGQIDEAREKLDRVYAVDDSWREFLRRLTITGLVPNDPVVIARLTEG